jgi:hypothetical protein
MTTTGKWCHHNKQQSTKNLTRVVYIADIADWVIVLGCCRLIAMLLGSKKSDSERWLLEMARTPVRSQSYHSPSYYNTKKSLLGSKATIVYHGWWWRSYDFSSTTALLSSSLLSARFWKAFLITLLIRAVVFSRSQTCRNPPIFLSKPDAKEENSSNGCQIPRCMDFSSDFKII